MIKEIVKDSLKIKMDIETDYEEQRFLNFFSKEPETISWIEQLMGKGDIFFDIGANVGVYSLFAAAICNDEIKVFSFEPAFHNFNKLCRNIALNNFQNILPYCLALSNETKLNVMHLASQMSGSASHIFKNAPEHLSQDFVSVFNQGVTDIKLDDLVSQYGLPCPNFIKIDIDGFEENAIDGACELMKNSNLKSVLMEITDIRGVKDRILKKMSNFGYVFNHPINRQENHSRSRRKKNNNKIENIIFTR